MDRRHVNPEAVGVGSFVAQLGKLRSDCQSDRAAVVNRRAGCHPAPHARDVLMWPRAYTEGGVNRRGSYMRKAKKPAAAQLRSEYKRSDFGPLVRGKYIQRLRATSNVVVVDPEVADLFPNAAAVNAALRSLAEIARRADSRRSRP